jgi:UDP-glucose 4-epimerase
LNNRVVILGHTGFLGSKLLEYFSDILGCDLVVGFSSKDIDFLDDESHSLLAVKLQKKDTVIVCTGIKKQIGNDAVSYRENMKITSNIAKGLRESPVSKVVYVSSCAVYGEDLAFSESITESTAPLPRSFYGLSKVHSEELLKFSLLHAQTETLLIVRPTTVYGDVDKHNYDPSGFVYRLRDQGEIQMWGDGTEVRDFVYIDDFCRVMYRLIQKGASDVVNIVSGFSISFSEIATEIGKFTELSDKLKFNRRTNKKVDHHYKNRALGKWLPAYKYLNNKEVIRELVCEILKESIREL